MNSSAYSRDAEIKSPDDDIEIVIEKVAYAAVQCNLWESGVSNSKRPGLVQNRAQVSVDRSTGQGRLMCISAIVPPHIIEPAAVGGQDRNPSASFKLSDLS